MTTSSTSRPAGTLANPRRTRLVARVLDLTQSPAAEQQRPAVPTTASPR